MSEILGAERHPSESTQAVAPDGGDRGGYGGGGGTHGCGGGAHGCGGGAHGCGRRWASHRRVDALSATMTSTTGSTTLLTVLSELVPEAGETPERTPYSTNWLAMIAKPAPAATHRPGMRRRINNTAAVTRTAARTRRTIPWNTRNPGTHSRMAVPVSESSAATARYPRNVKPWNTASTRHSTIAVTAVPELGGGGPNG
ncbi:hypothetical protein FZ046_20185 [Mycolicibacterium grossiae]|nr:hypothetical protein FZ046_20185 [Mycolicibacterium grossiae]